MYICGIWGLFHGLRTFSSPSDHQSSKVFGGFQPLQGGASIMSINHWCILGKKRHQLKKKKHIFSEWTWKPCDIHLVTNTFVPWSSQVSWSPLVIPFGNPFKLSGWPSKKWLTTMTRPRWDHHDLAGYSSGKLAGWPTPLKIMVYCLMGLMIVIQWDIHGIYPLVNCYSLRTGKLHIYFVDLPISS
jgi:hypothetical protein